jgi:hypothetical protein
MKRGYWLSISLNMQDISKKAGGYYPGYGNRTIASENGYISIP